MPVLEAIPAPAIIKAFRGTLDFYCYRGLACSRSWPRRPTQPRAPAVAAAAALFAGYARRASNTHPIIQQEAAIDAQGTAWTWRDVVTAAAYGTLNRW